MKKLYYLLWLAILVSSCSEDISQVGPGANQQKNLTIFFVNDQHGQLENFAKVKHIVEEEKKETNVMLVCSGDLFSGNPVVDYYSDKGHPMVDVMNEVGFDLCTIGNHEFDYGEEILKKRMNQADFGWLCANIDMKNTGIPVPDAYKTLTVGDIKVTFLGLLETNGKQNDVIPSTHPGKVKNIGFERPENVVNRYAGVKATENADVYVALTHLGRNGNSTVLGDFQLAEKFPYFDLIIGGHSHTTVDTEVNGIPIFQTNGYLRAMGKIELVIENKKVKSLNYSEIDLNQYTEENATVRAKIDAYDLEMATLLDKKVGTAAIAHSTRQLGCFYTDVLVSEMNVDIALQNAGGIRAGLDVGEITTREVYRMDPFNNDAHIYTFTVSDFTKFLKESNAGFYYSGLQITQNGDAIELRDSGGALLNANTSITLGINDYIPAVYDDYFISTPQVQPFTTAELLIKHLENRTTSVSYPDCQQYFEYQ